VLLIFTKPPALVSPAGGKPPMPVKNIAKAGNPLWLAAVEVRNKTSVESGDTPLQVATFVPQTAVYVVPVRELPVVVAKFTLL
jgi:hypothetical protein